MDGNTYIKLLQEAYVRNGLEKNWNHLIDISHGISQKEKQDLYDEYPNIPKALTEILEKIDGTYWREYKGEKVTYYFFGSDVSDGEYPYYLYSFKDIMKAKYSVAIAPIEHTSSVSYKCNGINMSSFPEDLQNAITENLVSSRRLNIVDRTSMNARMKELSLTTAGLTDRNDISKLAKVLSADYMLVLTVDTYNLSQNSRVLEVTGETIKSVNGRISVSYKLFETATTEIVAASHVEESINLQNASLSCSDLSSKLLKKVAKSQSDKMLSFLFKDYTPVVEKTSTQSTNTTPAAPKKKVVVDMPWM